MLPEWSKYKGLAYGVTSEPMVIAYNSRLVPAEDVPTSRADLIKLLAEKPDQYRGKVTMPSVDSGLFGYLLHTADLKKDKEGTLALFAAMGKAEVKSYNSSGAMLEKLNSGEHLIGYNLIGSYLNEKRKADPTIGLVFPKDYTTVMSRVAFIPTAAKHPNAGKLFLDFLLSKEGQTLLAARSMFPVRTDLSGDKNLAIPGLSDLPPEAISPIPIDGWLAETMKPDFRLAVIEQYKALVAAQ